MILASAALSHFAVLINDVFLLRWQAEHLSTGAPESFFNGFFPIGYPLVLRAVSFTGNPVLSLMLVQIALAPLYATLVYRLFIRLDLTDVHDARKISNGWRTMAIALPLALFAPPVIHAIPSATPDFFAALAVLTGFLFITHEGRWNFILAGAFVGLGCLFRSHVLVLLLTISLSLLLFHNEQRVRAFVSFFGGTLPFVIAQGLLQLWSGHGFLENAQAFNIWKTMHGMDWSNPPALGHARALGVILEDPMLFVTATFNWLLQYSFYLIPLVGIVILAYVKFRSGGTPVSRTLLLLALASLAYLGVTAAGASVSAFTPIIPVVAACVIPLVEFILSRRSNVFRTRTIATITILVWLGGLIGLFISTMHVKTRAEDYVQIEQMLRVHSRSDALAIYTDDYDLYFPSLVYQTPRTSGGWAEMGLPGYLDKFPHIRNTSAETEYADLIQNGVTWAIFRIPPYDPRGYKSVSSDTTRFRLTYRTPLHEIYRVEPHMDGGGRR